jgi:hypothetical protein
MISRKEQHKLMKQVKEKKKRLHLTWKEVDKVSDINTLSDLRKYLQKNNILTNDENLIDRLIAWATKL